MTPLFSRTDPRDRKTEGGPPFRFPHRSCVLNFFFAFPSQRYQAHTHTHKYTPKGRALPRKASSSPLALSSLTPRPAYLVRSYPVKRFSPCWPRGAFGLASQEEVGNGCLPLGAEPDKPGHEELASLLAISSNFFQALIPWGVGCGAGTKMRKSRVYRMVLATCLGSLLLVIFYFQSSLNPGELNIYPAAPSRHLFFSRLGAVSKGMFFQEGRRVGGGATHTLSFFPPSPQIETMKRLVALLASLFSRFISGVKFFPRETQQHT